MAEITGEQIRVLQHMLGAFSRIRKALWGYRNHYCVYPGSPSYRLLERMEQGGFVERNKRSTSPVIFHATPKGRQLIGLSEAQYRKAQQ